MTLISSSFCSSKWAFLRNVSFPCVLTVVKLAEIFGLSLRFRDLEGVLVLRFRDLEGVFVLRFRDLEGVLVLRFRDLEGVFVLRFRDLEGVLGLSFRDTQFLTRGYARAYHELLQGLRYANESLAHS